MSQRLVSTTCRDGGGKTCYTNAWSGDSLGTPGPRCFISMWGKGWGLHRSCDEARANGPALTSSFSGMGHLPWPWSRSTTVQQSQDTGWEEPSSLSNCSSSAFRARAGVRRRQIDGIVKWGYRTGFLLSPSPHHSLWAVDCAWNITENRSFHQMGNPTTISRILPAHLLHLLYLTSCYRESFLLPLKRLTPHTCSGPLWHRNCSFFLSPASSPFPFLYWVTALTHRKL